MKYIFLLCFLAGCSATPVNVCNVHVKDWSDDEQLQTLKEEQFLPQSSIIVDMLRDYADMRTEARICLSQNN